MELDGSRVLLGLLLPHYLEFWVLGVPPVDVGSPENARPDKQLYRRGKVPLIVEGLARVTCLGNKEL